MKYSKLLSLLYLRTSLKVRHNQSRLFQCCNCLKYATNDVSRGIFPISQVRFCTTKAVQSESESTLFDFESLLQSVQRSSTKFDESILNNCSSNIERFTEEQILQLIVASKGIPKSDAVQSLISLLEDQCIHRSSLWNTEIFMNFLKRYHETGLLRNSRFSEYALQSRARYFFNEASLPVLLDFLRIINDSDICFRGQFRRCDLEVALQKYLPSLQAHEVPLFFDLLVATNKNIVHHKLKIELCEWFVDQAEVLPEAVIKKFLLLIGRPKSDPTNPLFVTQSLVKVLKAIEGRIMEFDLQCVSVIASTCSGKMIFDENILEKIAHKLLDSMNTADVYDIEAVVHTLAHFNYHSNTVDIYQEITKNLRRQPLYSRLKEKPRLLCRMLANLSFVDVYPFGLLSLNLSKECLKRSYKSLSKYNVPYDLRVLVGGLRVERPEYKGHKINFNIIRHHTRKHKLTFPAILSKHGFVEIDENSEDTSLSASRELSPYNRALYCTQILLDHIFRSVEYTHICFPLLHSSKANIVLCANKEKQFQKLAPQVTSKLVLRLGELDRENLQYFVIVFSAKNIHMDYEPFLMGEEIAKARQLQKLGFKTIPVVQHGWLKINLKEKIATLKKLLFEDGYSMGDT